MTIKLIKFINQVSHLLNINILMESQIIVWLIKIIILQIIHLNLILITYQEQKELLLISVILIQPKLIKTQLHWDIQVLIWTPQLMEFLTNMLIKVL